VDEDRQYSGDSPIWKGKTRVGKDAERAVPT
jgi:hypothetical protein